MKDEWAKRREARLADEQAMREAEKQQQAEMDRLIAALQGAKGDKGDTGDTGGPGDPGPVGDVGLPGRDGTDGSHGRDGANGSDGSAGRDGRNGMDGSPGTPGELGPRGLPGAYTMRSTFQYDGQRLTGVVEFLSDGTSRLLAVKRNDQGRPVDLVPMED